MKYKNNKLSCFKLLVQIFFKAKMKNNMKRLTHVTTSLKKFFPKEFLSKE